MKKIYIILALTAALLSLLSCAGGQGNGSKPTNSGKSLFSGCKTHNEVLEISSAKRYSEIPDTVFLDFYLTMPVKELKALCDKYEKENKLNYYGLNYGGDGLTYTYELPISADKSLLVYVSFEYYKDQLAGIIMSVDNSDDRLGTGLNDLYFLENYFEPMYVNKGYFTVLQGFSEAELQNEVQSRKRTENGLKDVLVDPERNKDFDGQPLISFYKGNTQITLSQIVDCIPVIVIYDTILQKKKYDGDSDIIDADEQSMKQGRADF